MKTTLQGLDALLFHACKGGIPRIENVITRLQAVVAVYAGLPSIGLVRQVDFVRPMATLIDQLAQSGHELNPMQSLVGYFNIVAVADTKGAKTDVFEDILYGMVGTLQMCRIRTKEGECLIEWKSALPPDLDEQVARLAGIADNLTH